MKTIAWKQGLVLSLVYAAVVPALGCSSERGRGDEEVAGEATIAITQAPGDVRCARLTVDGSRTVTQSFDVTPGQSTVFALHGLPLGNDLFSAEAFDAACSNVGYGVLATWVSDLVPAPVVRGQITMVTLPMHRNGRASVGLDFPDGGEGGGGCTQAGCIVELAIPTKESLTQYITMGLDSDLFFTETNGNKLGHVDAKNAFLEWPLPPGFSAPQALVADRGGDIWFGVAEGLMRFFRRDWTFQPVKVRGGVTHVALAPNGSVWFSEHTADIVGSISENGELAEFAVPAGSGPDGLAVDASGNVWVALEDAGVVVRMSPDGKIMNRVPLKGVGPGGGCLMIGGDGRVWVSEFSTDTLARLGVVVQGGIETITVDELPLAPGAGPLGIAAVDTNTWFTEFGANRLGWANPNGGLVEIPIPTAASGPVGVAIWGTRAGATANLPATVWFAESKANQIGYIRL